MQIIDCLSQSLNKFVHALLFCCTLRNVSSSLHITSAYRTFSDCTLYKEGEKNGAITHFVHRCTGLHVDCVQPISAITYRLSHTFFRWWKYATLSLWLCFFVKHLAYLHLCTTSSLEGGGDSNWKQASSQS